MPPDQNSNWSDSDILRTIPNPDPKLCYVTEIVNPEVTFLGVKEQPDFAEVTVEYIAGEGVIELKSLKKYFGDFRQRVLSYERFISVVYHDLMQKYQPRWLKLTAKFNRRGGISSTLIVDSARLTVELASAVDSS